MLIRFPDVVFQHFSKSDKRVDWLDDRHGLSPILCDSDILCLNCSVILSLSIH